MKYSQELGGVKIQTGPTVWSHSRETKPFYITVAQKKKQWNCAPSTMRITQQVGSHAKQNIRRKNNATNTSTL